MPSIRSSPRPAGRTGITLGVLLCATLAGCAVPATVVLSAAAPVAHAGTAAYIDNELIFAFDAPLATVRAGVEHAYTTLQLDPKLDRPTRDAQGRVTKLYMLSESLDQTPVEIRLEAITPALTRVSVRFGFWGDQAVSRAILTKIEQFLKPLRPDQGNSDVDRNLSQ